MFLDLGIDFTKKSQNQIWMTRLIFCQLMDKIFPTPGSIEPGRLSD